MSRWNKFSLRLLADKLMDLANLIAGSLIISQIVSKDKSIVLLIGGIIIVVVFYFISFLISR